MSQLIHRNQHRLTFCPSNHSPLLHLNGFELLFASSHTSNHNSHNHKKLDNTGKHWLLQTLYPTTNVVFVARTVLTIVIVFVTCLVAVVTFAKL